MCISIGRGFCLFCSLLLFQSLEQYLAYSRPSATICSWNEIMNGWLTSFSASREVHLHPRAALGPGCCCCPRDQPSFQHFRFPIPGEEARTFSNTCTLHPRFQLLSQKLQMGGLQIDVFCWDCWIFVFLIKWISYQHLKNWETSYNNLDFLLVLMKQGWLYLPALLSGASWGACALWFSMVLIRHTFLFIEIARLPRHWNVQTSYGKYTNSWGYHSPWPS